MRSCCVCMSAILQEIPKISLLDMSLKMTNLRLQLRFAEAGELIDISTCILLHELVENVWRMFYILSAVVTSANTLTKTTYPNGSGHKVTRNVTSPLSIEPPPYTTCISSSGSDSSTGEPWNNGAGIAGRSWLNKRDVTYVMLLLIDLTQS